MDVIKDIENYIMLLKSNFKLFISLHPSINKETLISSGQLMRFNFHENSYCAFIKQNSKANSHCVECQKKVFNACSKGIFNGVCFTGVSERVYPFGNGDEITGFISVSGYKTENADSYFEKLSKQYAFSKNELACIYETLKPIKPNDNYLDTLIKPLCHMIELAYKKESFNNRELPFGEQVARYIKQNRNADITSQSICKQFNCSRSFMSTEFNKFKGKGIREYINELRINDAKALLSTTNLTVTEIAFTIGFNSSNYFSKLFTEAVGFSPLGYRKASRK